MVIQDNIIASQSLNKNATNKIFSNELNNNKLYFYNPIPHLGTIIKKDALINAGLYTEKRRSQFDWDLWLKLAGNNNRFYFFNINTGIKRIHGNQSFELNNHFLYTFRGVKLQLYYSLKNAKGILIPVLLVSLLRVIWSFFPRRFRIFNNSRK